MAPMKEKDQDDKTKQEGIATEPLRVSSQEEPMYYMENGLMVFTRAFHLKRGYCCQSGCRHCPWDFGKESELGSKE